MVVGRVTNRVLIDSSFHLNKFDKILPVRVYLGYE